MKRSTLSLLTALVLALTLTLPSAAAEGEFSRAAAAGATLSGNGGITPRASARAGLISGNQGEPTLSPIALSAGEAALAEAGSLGGEGGGADTASDVPLGAGSAALVREETGGVPPGGQIELVLTLTGDPLLGLECEVVFDDAQLTLVSAESLLPDWRAYLSGTRLLMTPDTLETPLHAAAPSPVCRFTFRATEGTTRATPFSVSLAHLTVTSGTAASYPGDPVYEGRLIPPDSGAARLTALSAGEYPLTPPFSQDIFEYTVRDLPHSLETLPLQATAAEGCTVTENNPSLVDGANTISLTVAAPDGSETVYLLHAHRYPEGYVPSSEARLSALAPSAGALSPVFSPDVREYLLYLPSEAGATVSLLPTPLDERASAQPVSATLAADSGGALESAVLRVVCVAEDGGTLDYRVTVLPLPAFAGTAPYVNGSATLSGEAEVVEVEGGYGVRLSLDRPDTKYLVNWSFEGEPISTGKTLPRAKSLRAGDLTATITGTEGFAGTLVARVFLDERGDISPDGAGVLTPARFALLAGGALGALLIGFFAGRAVRKRKK